MLPPPSGLARIAWPWRVRVFTLGTFRIEIDGEPLVFSGKVQKAPLNLLKSLIALSGENVAEHRPEEALWPDSEGDAARQALATTLNRLRKLIGPEAITRHGGVLSLNTALVWCDAQALSSLLVAQVDDSVTVLSAIELLYRGPFLSPDEEHGWALPMRDHIDKIVASAMLGAACRYANAGRHDEAIALCRRGLEIDDLAESLYEIAMRSLLATEHKAEAVRLYRQCEYEFSTRLNVAPSPAIKAACLSALAAAPAGSKSA